VSNYTIHSTMHYVIRNPPPNEDVATPMATQTAADRNAPEQFTPVHVVFSRPY